jgi:hypothetical protein
VTAKITGTLLNEDPGAPTLAPALSPDEVADEPNSSKKKMKAALAPADNAELPSLDFYYFYFYF